MTQLLKMMNSGKCKLFFGIFFLLFPLILSAETRDCFDGVTGGLWLDSDGNHIQAHGGQVQKIGDKWYWVGENRNGSRHICMYSSDDLYNWKFEGYVMRVMSSKSAFDTDSYFKSLYGDLTSEEKDAVYDGIRSSRVIERPKLIYNKKTNKYIIWFHADNSNYGFAGAGVAISDNVTGPYKFIKRSRLHQLPDDAYGSQWYEASNYRGYARDMTLFVDDDNTAYIIYSSEENRTMFISRLNDEYTDLDVAQTPVGLAQNKVDFVRLFPGAQREAPAMFKYNGIYYMITSGATGWDPNQGQYWMANEIFGEWKNMGDPCVNQAGIPHPANLTFRTQSTCVFPVDTANGLFIYMGDRWNSSDLKDSRYVWLPVTFTASQGIQLKSRTDWNLSAFDSINYIKLDAEQYKNIYFRNEDLPEKVCVQVRKKTEWEDQYFDISWKSNISNLAPASLVNISGTFTIDGTTMTAKAKAINIPEKLLYYIDCGGTAGSEIYDSIMTKQLAPRLINTERYDQAFSEKSGWGYTGIVGTDFDYNNKESKNAYASGWLAHSNKTIDYKLALKNGSYRLVVGFQEWFGLSRSMRISMIYENESGESTTKSLGTASNSTETAQNFSFKLTDLSADNPYITISISKTGTNDPVLSWFSLTDTGTDTSIDNLLLSDNDKKLHIYPGIVTKNQPISIKIRDNEDFTDACIHIYNTSGQLIKQQKVTENITEVNLSVPSGIYIVRFKEKVAKLIVK